MLTITEAAEATNINRDTLASAVKDGRVPSQIVLGRRAVRLDDVRRALADGRIRPGQTGRPRKKPPTE